MQLGRKAIECYCKPDPDRPGYVAENIMVIITRMSSNILVKYKRYSIVKHNSDMNIKLVHNIVYSPLIVASLRHDFTFMTEISMRETFNNEITQKLIYFTFTLHLTHSVLEYIAK